jgi:hypothetical protein
MFSHCPSLFLFFLEIYFEAPHDELVVKSLIWWAHSGLKSSFFHLGLQNKFLGKKIKTWNDKGKT